MLIQRGLVSLNMDSLFDLMLETTTNDHQYCEVISCLYHTTTSAMCLPTERVHRGKMKHAFLFNTFSHCPVINLQLKQYAK